ncbi:hypothetical protein OGY68_21280, partial [Citrobacter sp. Cpo065]|nr:hypothetical protein [Citrobacter sp. Cpo065]
YPAYACGIVCAGWRLTSYPAYVCSVVYAGWRLTSYPAYVCGIVCRPDKRSASGDAGSNLINRR